jgi:hypothetical protein
VLGAGQELQKQKLTVAMLMYSYVVPLLAKPMDLRRHEELDTSKDVVVPQ